ncbi:MAG: metal ABC transporter permease [Lachnospiraceae bacterium]|nr:metal ABC transporter permease [Lachnospiraceae bacterium]
MEAIYSILDRLLPFAWAEHEFMKHAFLAVLLMTPMLGMLGTIVVQKKMTFFSDALGHSAITGIGIGVVLGVSEINVTMLIFAVIFGLLLNKIKSRQTESADTVISVFASCSIAAGLIILSGSGEFNRFSGILAGDILSITEREIGYLMLAFLALWLFWLLGFNQILAVSIHGTLAKSRGIKVKLLDNLFVVLVAVIVTLSIKCIGILLINALLIIPVAAARNLSANMREYHLFAILFSLFSGMAGLIVSYYISVATGPMIVLFASVIYFATLIYSRLLY